MVRDELRRLIERYGRDIAVQSARVGGLLRDTVGQYRREISLLLAASEEGVAAELRDDLGSSAVPGRTNQLARRLESNRGISAENARWAVETWAYALAAEEEDIDTVEPPAEAVPTPAATEGAEAPPAPPPPPVPPVKEPTPAPVAEEPVAPATSPAAATPPASESRPPRRRAAVVAAVVAGLVLVGGIGFTLTRGGGEESGATETTGPTPGGSSITTTPPSQGGPDQIVLNAPGHLQVTHGPPSLNPYVKITWKTPANGDKPTRYAIYRGNASDPVKQTSKHSWVDHNVDWGTSYTYRVKSLSGENQSDAASKTVSVPNPPISLARLEGSASTGTRLVYHAPYDAARFWSHSITWNFSPHCSSGPCSVGWSASHHFSYRVGSTSGVLNLTGGTYSGSDVTPVERTRCGSTVAPASVRISIHVTGATQIGSQWRATKFSGTMAEYTDWPPGCNGGRTVHTATWTFSGTLH